MKKITFLLIFMYSLSFAQIGIGTQNPQAALDISSTNHGLLVPRIALTSTLDVTSVVNPTGNPLVNGTLIYNTVNAGSAPNSVSPGFYNWNTNRWVRINNGTKTETILSSAVTEPNPGIVSSTPSALTSAGINSTGYTLDYSYATPQINVSGYTGNISNITCNVVIGNAWPKDIDLYLQSPSGQIIELSTDNGPNNTITSFNVTFSDAAPTNITTWTTGNPSGSFRPEGTLVTNAVFPTPVTPTITTMSGFNGISPNGLWTLYVLDDAAIDNLNYTSFSLSIATYAPLNYRLVGEVPVIYKEGNDIVLNTSYSANSLDNEGVITALTTTAASVAASTTPANLSAYTTLSYASASPKQGAGNYWLASHNQAVSNGFVDGVTRYYQLWVKGNIETPTASNEQWSIIPIQIQK